jgi:predicted dehydrogenase
MSENQFSRRHFFYGTLLAGAVPAGGFGSVPSLSMLGYKSPNEKLNLAGIGAGNMGFASLSGAVAGVENVVALADVDWARGTEGFTTYERATKYKDFRQMLDKQGKEIDAVTIGIPDHMHAAAALPCMQLGKHVYVQKPLTRTSGEARLLTQAAEKYKVATQMGNQGISSEAARVACEIVWSGEIGDVTEVHAWMGRPSWPQGMTKIPPPTPVPDNLNWDLWLGTAAWREFTDGDQEYFDFIAARSARNRAGRGGAAPGAPAGAAAAGRGAATAGRGAAAGGRGAAAGRGNSIPTGNPGASVQVTGAYAGGFYLPFNWRGFYDFGSSLIGDWGVHIMGAAHWALQLDPKYLISVECVSKDSLPPFTFPDELTIKWEFGPRPGMGPVNVYWYQKGGGDAYLPPGMTAEEARQIPGTGPTISSGRGGAGAAGRAGAAAGQAPGRAGAPAAAAGAPQAARAGGGAAQQGSGYNCIFVGSKGYMGTSGQTGGVGLLPGKRWADYKLPTPYLPRSPGGNHYRDWVRACKGGAPGCSNFVSFAGPYQQWQLLGSAAVHTQGKLMWNDARGEFTNGKQVLQWVKPTYRKGWEIKL